MPHTPRPTTRSRAGFTLVELLIVVLLLAILGSVVMARATDSARDADQASLVTTLARMRQAIELYGAQHDAYPGRNVVIQLTRPTTADGRFAGPGASPPTFGPYLRAFPENPFNGSGAVLVVDELPARPGGAHGWIYVKTTGELRLNQPGRNAQGTPYYQL